MRYLFGGPRSEARMSRLPSHTRERYRCEKGLSLLLTPRPSCEATPAITIANTATSTTSTSSAIFLGRLTALPSTPPRCGTIEWHLQMECSSRNAVIVGVTRATACLETCVHLRGCLVVSQASATLERLPGWGWRQCPL